MINFIAVTSTQFGFQLRGPRSDPNSPRNLNTYCACIELTEDATDTCVSNPIKRGELILKMNYRKAVVRPKGEKPIPWYRLVRWRWGCYIRFLELMKEEYTEHNRMPETKKETKAKKKSVPYVPLQERLGLTDAQMEVRRKAQKRESLLWNRIASYKTHPQRNEVQFRIKIGNAINAYTDAVRTLRRLKANVPERDSHWIQNL
jgi:hypothetical protein